ncbi:histone-lysine N-methyltransferase SMYD3-like, partial [Oppia nitens]|uniref:histone-lysine N-methyltransferase SMYD3-like n=1 Tax=Oppia nitens TaxID=1686743 RepID=UPI0023DA9E7B
MLDKMYVTKGDLIITSKPFAFVLFSLEANYRCDQCFKILKTKISCFKCLKVAYCSRKCQSEATEQDNHRLECPVMMNRPLWTMTRLITRVIKRLEKSDTDMEVVIGNHKRDWSCLMDHYDNIVKDYSVMRDFELIYDDLCLIFGDTLPKMETIISIYGKLLINSFAIQDPLMKPIGRAIYLGPSIFDHSCRPSVSFMFIGTQLYIKAIKSMPITDITDLKISYIDEFETTDERQKILRSAYYFDCDCERCCLTECVVQMYEQKELRSFCEKIEQLSQEMMAKQLIARTGGSGHQNFGVSIAQNDNNIISELVANLRKDVMPLNTVLQVKIAEFVANRDNNFDLWIQVMDIFRRYYGDCHNRLAVKLYLLAKSANKYSSLKNQMLTEAKAIAVYITPNLRDYTRDQLTEKRDIVKYDRHQSLSDSLLNSTLLYLIES